MTQPYFNWNVADGLALSPFFIFQRHHLSFYPSWGGARIIVQQPPRVVQQVPRAQYSTRASFHSYEGPLYRVSINLRTGSEDVEETKALLLKHDEEQRARGYRRCKRCASWIHNTETYAEHDAEMHHSILTSARVRAAANKHFTDDDDPWIPDVSEYSSSRYERRTPLTRLDLPDEEEARSRNAQAYRNWQLRSGL